MNPLNWTSNEKIAAVLFVTIGVITSVIVGYFVYAIGSGAEGASSFGSWIDHPIRRGGIWWALTGAGICLAVIYIQRLLSK